MTKFSVLQVDADQTLRQIAALREHLIDMNEVRCTPMPPNDRSIIGVAEGSLGRDIWSIRVCSD
jgi:hypothetical protein